jgi:hypothetical protein
MDSYFKIRLVLKIDNIFNTQNFKNRKENIENNKTL